LTTKTLHFLATVRKRLNAILILWPGSAVLLLMLAAGCSQTSTPEPPGSDSQETPQDRAFESAANRPPTPQTMFALARILEIQGRDNDANTLLNQIIGLYPDFVPAYSELAELQVRHRQLDVAMDTLTAGLAIAPHDGLLVNDRGMCYLLEKNYPAALNDFTFACACQPDNTRYRSNLALVLGLMGNYQESLSVYLLILPPSDAYYNLGVICNMRHDSSRAEEEFATSKNLSQDSMTP